VSSFRLDFKHKTEIDEAIEQMPSFFKDILDKAIEAEYI